MPYGGPIVEMDALIGVKCIRCLDLSQNQHPTKQSFTRTELNMAQRRAAPCQKMSSETHNLYGVCVWIREAGVGGEFSVIWSCVNRLFLHKIFPALLNTLHTLNRQSSQSRLVCSFRQNKASNYIRTDSAARPSVPLNAVILLRRYRISVSGDNGRLVGPSISSSSAQGCALIGVGLLPDSTRN